MSREYCDFSDRCKNRGKDCERCSRSYDYEEASDCFEENYEGKTLIGAADDKEAS